MRHLLVFVALQFAFALGAPKAEACTCVGWTTSTREARLDAVRQALAAADTVFLGDFLSADETTATLTAAMVWKGYLGEKVRLRQATRQGNALVWNTCTMTVRAGRFVVFARVVEPGIVEARACGPSGSVEHQAETIEFLDELSRTQQQELRAGVATFAQGKAVLAMTGPALAAGASLTLVTTGFPQELHRATVVRSLADDKAVRDKTPGPYYEIVGAEAGRELPRLGIAVLGEPAPTRMGTALMLQVSPTLRDVRARSCASYEGVHLTLWSGEPLKTPRLWHAYYYAGYDTVMTCTPEDTRGGR